MRLKLQMKKSKYLFLNDDLWEGEDTPIDLAENHDHYLYDESGQDQDDIKNLGSIANED